MREEVLRFGEGRSLVGIVTDPPEGKRNLKAPGVILLNAGIVHRVGPYRLYVKMARGLAAMGTVVLRFDFSGIGDSIVRYDNLPFERSAVSEAQAAMNCLGQARGADRFVLIGLCSGAAVSVKTACCDPRVIGAVLINFELEEDEEGNTDRDLINRRAAFYYWKFALFNLNSWRKLLTGKTNYRHLIRVLRFQVNRRFASGMKMSREATQFKANLQTLASRGVRLTFLCSEIDPRLDDLREAGGNELKRLCALGKVAMAIIPRSDHTFSSRYDQERLLDVTLKKVNAMT